MENIFILILIATISAVQSDETDYNIINSDGSFSFGLSNNDIGSHYHSASGAVNKVVRGRYGSRNAANGRVEETTYTAGPRGFRSRGPNVHRKLDLLQVPRGPIGTKDDPLADPYEDPSYGFGFRTSDYQRREDADSSGRVRGLYSYIDDVGERHSVRYAAGAETGYEVLNAVPDAPSLVRYSAPLFKSSRNARGRISYERGPGAQYKFISSGPDQRRSESTGADGITRGSYSYLDDKGIQRTVEYIAGAGIGYRIVKSTTGPATHLLPRPTIPEFGIISPQSNDISDADGSGFKTAESGSVAPNRNRGGNNQNSGFAGQNNNNNPLLSGGASNFGGKNPNYNKQTGNTGNDFNNYDSSESNDNFRPNSLNRGNTKYPGNNNNNNNNNINNPAQHSNTPNHQDQPPYITTDQYGLEQDRQNDWTNNGQDSTIIKNTGNWFVGLAPGAAVRAHVQSIDLLPIGGRPPSPGDALRRDEQRSIKYY